MIDLKWMFVRGRGKRNRIESEMKTYKENVPIDSGNRSANFLIHVLNLNKPQATFMLTLRVLLLPNEGRLRVP